MKKAGSEGLNGGKVKNSTEDVVHRCLNSQGRSDHSKHPEFQSSVSSPYIAERFKHSLLKKLSLLMERCSNVLSFCQISFFFLD